MSRDFANIRVAFDTAFAELKRATDPAKRIDLLRSLRSLITQEDTRIENELLAIAAMTSGEDVEEK